MFLRLSSRQCLALLLVVLLVNRGATTSRRRYESPFEGLFNAMKTALKDGAEEAIKVMIINSIQSPHDGDPMKEVMGDLVKFAKANPDKIGVAVGLVASSWLLNQSIALGNEVQEFLNETKELRGQTNEYYLHKLPKLKEMFQQIKAIMRGLNEEHQKSFYNELDKLLTSYYLDLQGILDRIDVDMADFNKAKVDATINAVASGTIAVLSVGVLVAGGPVTLIWTSGVVATTIFSSVSTGLSLRNTIDLETAITRLNELRSDVKELKHHVTTMMMTITEFDKRHGQPKNERLCHHRIHR